MLLSIVKKFWQSQSLSWLQLLGNLYQIQYFLKNCSEFDQFFSDSDQFYQFCSDFAQFFSDFDQFWPINTVLILIYSVPILSNFFQILTNSVPILINLVPILTIFLMFWSHVVHEWRPWTTVSEGSPPSSQFMINGRRLARASPCGWLKQGDQPKKLSPLRI